MKYTRSVREVELWARMDAALGPAYSRVWAENTVLADLGSRTVVEALEAGIGCKRIWRAVWAQLELPPTMQ